MESVRLVLLEGTRIFLGGGGGGGATMLKFCYTTIYTLCILQL